MDKKRKLNEKDTRFEEPPDEVVFVVSEVPFETDLIQKIYIGFCTESQKLFEYIQENSCSLYSRCFRSEILFARMCSSMEKRKNVYRT